MDPLLTTYVWMRKEQRMPRCGQSLVAKQIVRKQNVIHANIRIHIHIHAAKYEVGVEGRGIELRFYFQCDFMLV